MKKLFFISFLMLAMFFLAGCGGGPAAAFTENGVAVTLTWVERSGQLYLQGEFAPIEDGYHLYSIDMDERGIDGVGRPTKIEIVSDNAVVSGPITADQPVIETVFEGFSAPFPLYPDGPVTLLVPVELKSGAAGQPLTLEITYIACSSGGICRPLVKNYPLMIDLPG